MWIAKGTVLGLWLLGFATTARLYFTVYRNLPSKSAASASVSVMTAITTRSPMWWITLVVSFFLGYWIARVWKAPLGVWIALVVTGLIPAGLLTMFLVLAYFVGIRK